MPAKIISPGGMKWCCTCKEHKLLEMFSNNKASRDGKHAQCKGCNKIESAKSRIRNKDKIKVRNKEKYWADVEKSKEDCRLQYQKHKKRKRAQNKQWKDANPEKYKECHRKWYLKNRKKKLRQNAEVERRKMKEDPLYRLKKNLRIRVIDALKGKAKSGKTFDMLGCTFQELRTHMERQFDEYMNWNNYGSYWHADHKIPCAAFDLSIPEEQNKCFHYTNLQPLEAGENLKKHANY